MQVVIMSDNHGRKMALEKVFHHYRNQPETIFVHCGDSEFPYEDSVFEDCYRVTGNCDYDEKYPDTVQLKVAGIPVMVTHGHLDWVNTGVGRLSKRAQELGAQVALYGHTHKLAEDTANGVLCINSGSVAYPRGHFADLPTYAVLMVQSPEEIQLTYYDMNHQAIEGLMYQYHWDEERGWIHD